MMIRHPSVLLSDWAANVELPGMSSPEAALYELLLLSLLYDEVAVQDEVFALSSKLSEWLLRTQAEDLVAKLFDVGSLVVLTHPLSAYPENRLAELASKRPIAARAQYISEYSTKDDAPFTSTLLQERLYDQIDSCLREMPQSRREVGSRGRRDLFGEFGYILRKVLSDRRYRSWVQAAFPGISDAMAADFLSYLHDPENVLRKADEKRRSLTVLRDPDGRPVLNRSFWYQAASLYPRGEAEAMHQLIQTCFAAPFCDREKAVGRYGPALKELLLLQAGMSEEPLNPETLVSVEASIDVDLPLPRLDANFADAVRSVRDEDVGRQLRDAVRRMGQDLDFAEQVEAWRAVSEALAMKVTPFKTVVVRASLVTYGERAIAGAVIGGITSSLLGEPIAIPNELTGALISEGVGVIWDHGYEFTRTAFRQQQVRQQLENVVKFRCTALPLPPLDHKESREG